VKGLHYYTERSQNLDLFVKFDFLPRDSGKTLSCSMRRKKDSNANPEIVNRVNVVVNVVGLKLSKLQ